MSLLITTYLDAYTDDGDLVTDDNKDIIFTMLSTFSWPQSNLNLLKFEIPLGSGLRNTYLEVMQLYAAFNALSQALGTIRTTARIDAWQLMGAEFSNGPMPIAGAGYDVTATLVQLPKRAESAGVTARPAINLVTMKVPLGSSLFHEAHLSYDQLQRGIQVLQTESAV